MFDFADLKSQLELKAAPLVGTFGSAETLLATIWANVSLPSEVDRRVSTFLTHPDHMLVISPSNLSFKLYDNYQEVLQNNSIILEQPYSVYDQLGKLLYRVSNHNGIFGYSLLDRQLLLESKPTDYYYLHFNTYAGKRVLLLVCATNSGTKKVNTSGLLNGPAYSLSEENNILYLDAINTSRNINVSGFPYYPIKTYFLASPPSAKPTISQIKLNPLTNTQTYSLDFGTALTIQPQTSGWLVITQLATSEVNLTINNLTGAGVSQLLEANPSLYYISLGSEISPNTLRQTIGQAGTNYTQQTLNLRGVLN